jgi:hypothetical protein
MRMITKTRLTFLAAAITAGFAAGAPTTGTTGEKTWSGTVVAVDPGNKTVTARDWLGMKKVFHLGDKCGVATLDKEEASVNDLHPGEKVRIQYQEEQGVRVASRIVELRLRLEGTVEGVNPESRTVTLKAATSRTTLHLAASCDILRRDGKSGKLADLKPGDKISLVYQRPDHSPVAYQIQEEYLRFTGALNAVDLDARTAKASQLFSEKKFSLAKGCEVRLPDRGHGRLTDLKLGQRYEFSYADIDGVNVVDHITEVMGAPPAETASTPPIQP